MQSFFRLRVGPNRWRFLSEALSDLDKNLRKLNSKLYVIRGNPQEEFASIFKEWNVVLLTFEHDIEPYSIDRDRFVKKIAERHQVEIVRENSLTIFDPQLVIARNKGSPPMTYQKFLSVSSSLPVPSPVEIPKKVSDHCHPEQDKREVKDPNCYSVPSLEELGVDSKTLNDVKFPGGESEALRRMEMNLKKTKYICQFEKPNTSPNSLEPSTTVLSPYIKFGCLSARLFYKRLRDVYKGNKHSKPPVSLEGQLFWREFYYCVASVTDNFDRMAGNKICAQIPWKNDKDFLEAWTYGMTGYPFIDAIMRQLRQEGW